MGLLERGAYAAEELNEALLKGRVKKHTSHLFVVFEHPPKDAFKGTLGSQQVPFALAVETARLGVIRFKAKIVGHAPIELGGKPAFEGSAFDQAWGMDFA